MSSNITTCRKIEIKNKKMHEYDCTGWIFVPIFVFPLILWLPRDYLTQGLKKKKEKNNKTKIKSSKCDNFTNLPRLTMDVKQLLVLLISEVNTYKTFLEFFSEKNSAA